MMLTLLNSVAVFLKDKQKPLREATKQETAQRVVPSRPAGKQAHAISKPVPEGMKRECKVISTSLWTGPTPEVYIHDIQMAISFFDQSQKLCFPLSIALSP